MIVPGNGNLITSLDIKYAPGHPIITEGGKRAFDDLYEQLRQNPIADITRSIARAS